jgi:hypothetical protein
MSVSAPNRLLQLLRENWRWWAVPMLIMLLLTCVFAYLQHGENVAVIDYGNAPHGH